MSGRAFLTSILILGLLNVGWSMIESDIWSARLMTYALFGGHALVFSIVAAAFLYAKFRAFVVFSLILVGPIISHGGAWFLSASGRLPPAWEVPWLFLTPALAALLYLGIVRFLLQLRMPDLELFGWSALTAVSMSPVFAPEAMFDALGRSSWLGLHILIWYGIAAFAIYRMTGMPTGDESLRGGDVQTSS